jgi:predicted transcriptional regulator
MDMQTAPTERRHWRTVLKEQERSMAWLARQTGRPQRSIYAYSQGQMQPTPEWLAKASEVLGVEVTA